MNKIKAIILDLDGTLLDDNKKIGDKTIHYLKQIKNNVKIIPASARQFCTIKPYLENLGLLDENNYTICFNGSLIVNNKESEIFSSYIDKSVVIKIDNFILDNKIDWTYYLYDNRLLRNEISNIEKFANENKIYKIVGVSTTSVINKIRSNLPKEALENLEITSSELNRIEFVNKGMTKVKAIELLLNKLDIDKENVVAIGDGDNDIDMIKYVGCGIAMSNSPEIVKENADIVTEYSNNEDGVYYAIKELLRKEEIMMNDNNRQNTTINSYPGHMAKARRLIREKYDLIDIVYEVVDARIPLSSKIKDIYDIIGNKPKILIMTKKDLCDLKATNYWVKYYENLGNHVILADLNNTEDYKKIIEITHEITKKEQNARIKKGMKEKEIKALVIGIPNVGKSTLINRMCGRKVANVGNNPGVTKNLSWLRTRYDILLLDTPGILWPKLDNQEIALNLASFSAIKQEILPVDEVAIHILQKLYSLYPKNLKDRYGVTQIEDIEKTYETIGKKIGALKNGEPDYERISKYIISDLKQENIKGVTFDR